MPSTILVHVTASPRGGSRTEVSFHAQSINITSGWGSSPATGTVVYVSADLIAASPVTVGDGIRITVGGHLYYGICRNDTVAVTSSGHNRVLEFVDYRELLNYDSVFCAFNIPEIRLVNGRRLKRYWHILPADYNAGLRTYTNTPLLAYEILDYLFSANTVATSWTREYSGLLSTPVYGLDCLGGRNLSAVVAEISERLGVVYAHDPLDAEIFRLLWTRKGMAGIPGFPVNSDNRRIGTALSNHPNRIRIVGDVNLYQVMEVAMTKDWAPGWEEFPDFDLFVNDIYNRQFADIEDDPEQIIGRQRARVTALQMTVREYVDIRGGTSFTDQRKLSGRSRMDMPVALYLSTLLYRAFRPADVSFVNVYGRTIPLSRAAMLGGLLARVSHDPTSGDMALDLDDFGRPQPADGTGYAIAKGYMVGQDLFATIRPERFNISEWVAANDVWRYVPFQIDDSGEPQNAFIIFDDPVIVANDLLTVVDGHAVVKAYPTLTVPPVTAALTFSCEHYFWPLNDEGYLGSGSRDGVENVPSLNGEYVVQGGLTEVPYADGRSVDDKAEEIAVNLLNRQAVYADGGYLVKGSNATPITSAVDRVQVSTSPQGLLETVDFTNERGRANFEPERELDRRTVQNSYFPGQIELIQEARKAKLITAGLRQMPGFVRFLSRLLRGDLGSGPSGEVLRQYQVDPAALDGDTETYSMGTPFWKEPTGASTMVLPPVAGIEEAKVFAGVTVREGEVSSAPFLLQSTGLGLVRVKGPIEVGDTVGRDSELVGDYLIRSGNPAVGIALQAISDSTVTLIQVQLGSGASSGGNSGLYQLRDTNPDYLVCRAATILESGFIETGSENVLIAKPYDLRRTPFNGETIDGVLYDAFNGDGTQRRATRGDVVEQEVVIPPYIDDPTEGGNRSIIRAISVQHTGVFVGGQELVLEEVSPRYFAEIDD